ncbi:hypothetical protein N658DRAFT_508019 [Parathielavia hyrcaniae]|uniref:Uncharacterized protein n=1 Tax=Parathielavia hyrcaniae TaxID=113614 RepID=A0AAN6T079_9PEZI|nr:hypothetical protein N658DRAFT_508019 [Parathielavia hyrcaniae]
MAKDFRPQAPSSRTLTDRLARRARGAFVAGFKLAANTFAAPDCSKLCAFASGERRYWAAGSQSQNELLAAGKLGETAANRLPDLTDDVDRCANLPLMNALFRNYSFPASAYLLEQPG